MKIKVLIFFVILSFIAPAIHFIEHNHSYNPFTNKLEHQDGLVNKSFKKSYNLNSEIEKSNVISLENDICKVKIFNNFLKNNYYTPLAYHKLSSNYIYELNIYKNSINKNNIILIAPKNSPPYILS